ncbi:hypothetical protein AB0M28_02480 [Streptomyces sp. NPDC051940]|uniref:hypothetical protein n=1 Tax=Streptomyces sp. NPDC051940 TaxID=3155675 RepID=UPI00342F83DE
MGEVPAPGTFGPYPGSGVMLGRLMAYRGLDAEALARAAEVDAGALRAVLDGGEPDPETVGRLAPVLGLHTVDLHVVMWTAVPHRLAPLDPEAAVAVRQMLGDLVRLSAGRVTEVLMLVRSLPQEPRTVPYAEHPTLESGFRPTLGGVLVRMLLNRNLRLPAIAEAMGRWTPTYLSIATYPAIGSGRSELTPGRVADFAALLGLPAGLLAALTGIEPTERGSRHHPTVDLVAQLVWEMRRLTADQSEQVRASVRSHAGR